MAARDPHLDLVQPGAGFSVHPCAAAEDAAPTSRFRVLLRTSPATRMSILMHVAPGASCEERVALLHDIVRLRNNVPAGATIAIARKPDGSHYALYVSSESLPKKHRRVECPSLKKSRGDKSRRRRAVQERQEIARELEKAIAASLPGGVIVAAADGPGRRGFGGKGLLYDHGAS
jgi:hypothetical protein